MKKDIKRKSEMLIAEYGSDKTPLQLGAIQIPCYVLNDGTRVLSRNGMQKAIGYEGTSGDWLTRFVASKNIFHNIDSEIKAGLSDVIKFQRLGAGGSATATYGYEATKLIDLCDALITLNKSGLLLEKQIIYAEQAEIIIRSVAKVGIIALVDEVTGYQEEREKDALQIFLKKFLNDEKAKWIPTFPDEFWEAIFKMRGLNWSLANKGQKPQYIGHYINNYVYSRLAPQVLVELRRLNPKNEKGIRKGKHTQWIDVDYGHPKLKEHLNILVAFARATGYNWSNWTRMVERALPKFEHDGSQAPELSFDDM